MSILHKIYNDVYNLIITIVLASNHLNLTNKLASIMISQAIDLHTESTEFTEILNDVNFVTEIPLPCMLMKCSQF